MPAAQFNSSPSCLLPYSILHLCVANVSAQRANVSAQRANTSLWPSSSTLRSPLAFVSWSSTLRTSRSPSRVRHFVRNFASSSWTFSNQKELLASSSLSVCEFVSSFASKFEFVYWSPNQLISFSQLQTKRSNFPSPAAISRSSHHFV